MTQLWLNGRRMDSIPLLRRFMSACQDEETLLRILGELVRKYQAGRLAGWLIRQSEAQPAACARPPAERRKDANPPAVERTANPG